MRNWAAAGLCLLVLAGGVLAGCDPVLATAAGMTTLPATKKLPPDHLASWATGRDCSIIHFEKDGEYCREPEKAIDRSDTVCVRTLGAVECHPRADPYAVGNRPLASPPPKQQP